MYALVTMVTLMGGGVELYESKDKCMDAYKEAKIEWFMKDPITINDLQGQLVVITQDYKSYTITCLPVEGK